jgi:threonylcarbamoyladenosine tRNA methylthiotransferase MtaB
LLDDTNHNAALSVRFGKDYRLRPGIKVQDGCNTRCTYCIVPKARGTARSVPLEQVLSDAERLLAAGARELVLSGINLGKYQYADNGFLDLLKALQPLIKQARPARLRLSSLEPDDISNELVEYLAQNQTQICAHLHLPLQSGSSRILELMRRPYDAKDYLKCVELLRDKIPTIALSTDVIVGFPTESEADFEATMALCKQSEFSRIHAFRFSAREGTSAATMPSQVAPQVKKERAQVLAKLAAKLTTNDQQKRNSSSEQILIVRPGEGLSASYHEVEVAETIKAGELIEMRLVARSDKLIGSIM